jgi:uncharacterized protein (DUF1800 family)
MVKIMKAMKNSSSNLSNGLAQRAAAFVVMFALLASTFAIGASAQASKQQVQRVNEDRRILHVLNRLGFGARPGDVERVRAMGLDKYIAQQLNPQSIADSVADAKVQNLPSYNMSIAELYEKYPQPGKLLKQMQRRGDLPADLAALRKDQGNAGAAQQPNAPMMQDNDGAMKSPDAMTQSGNMAKSKSDATMPNGDAAKAGDDEAAKNGKSKEYRQAVREYYMHNGLQLPQRITSELQASRIMRAVYSERQLQEVMVDFWTNHFNVFANKGADKWMLPSYDRDTIRPHALGKFQDLLVATAQSPAMLFYLDNFQSVSPNAPLRPQRQQQRGSLFDMLINGRMTRRGINGNPNSPAPQPQPQQQQGAGQANAQVQPQPKRMKRGINENYARELMELHTLGVDGGYTQKDVQEVARCFTGWTINAPRGGAALMGNNDDAGKFYFNARQHDDGEKLVLGHKIPAGGGIKDGLMVLDILAHQPATARFIATKLSRRFVMDNPPTALIDRVAAAFTRSDGSISETLRAIFTSPEFNSPEAYRAKIKEPFELTVSAIRTLGGETNGAPAIHQWIARMGQPLYGYQTPNGYADNAEAWVNTGSLLERLNFGLALASNRIPGTRVDLARFVGDSNVNSGAVDKERIMDRFLNVILQGDISPRTKATLLKQMNQPTDALVAKTEMDKVADTVDNTRAAQRQLARNNIAPVGNPEVTKIVGLILGSPEFQRQ